MTGRSNRTTCFVCVCVCGVCVVCVCVCVVCVCVCGVCVWCVCVYGVCVCVCVCAVTDELVAGALHSDIVVFLTHHCKHLFLICIFCYSVCHDI